MDAGETITSVVGLLLLGLMIFGITQCSREELTTRKESDLKMIGTLQGCLTECPYQQGQATQDCLRICEEHFNQNTTVAKYNAEVSGRNTLGGCMQSCSDLSSDLETTCVKSCEYHYNIK